MQQGDVDKDVVICLHDIFGLRTEDGAPLQTHYRLQRQVVVGVLRRGRG